MKDLSLTKYVTENKLKLSSDEILELFDDLDKNKNKIIRSQLPFVLLLTSNFSSLTGIPIEECFSTGLEALNKSMLAFKNNNTAKFTTYAANMIKWDLYNLKDDLIRIPQNRKQMDDNPKAVTFSNLCAGDDDDMSYFVDGIIEEEEEDIYFDDELVSKIKLILKGTGTHGITDENRISYIILSYFGIGCKQKSTKKLAKELGVSHQRINTLKLQGLEKLKKYGNILVF